MSRHDLARSHAFSRIGDRGSGIPLIGWDLWYADSPRPRDINYLFHACAIIPSRHSTFQSDLSSLSQPVHDRRCCVALFIINAFDENGVYVFAI